MKGFHSLVIREKPSSERPCKGSKSYITEEAKTVKNKCCGLGHEVLTADLKESMSERTEI